MPFDGSGNYSRVHDWTTDRDNGIKIRADRMDDEMDDIAAAFNVVFFRNGLVPMTGDLAMGANDIKGIASGTVAAPSIQFSSDPNTGFYLVGVGELGIAANGVQRLRAHSTGVTVTGTATITDDLTVQDGATISSSLTVGNALAVTGAATVGGNLAVTGDITASGVNTFNNRSYFGTGAITASSVPVQINGQIRTGSIYLHRGEGTTPDVAAELLSNLAGVLRWNGNTVWTAANDGAGSGLDADTLDGVQGASYLQTANLLAGILAVDGAGSGIDADLLDGQQGAYYLPSASYTAADVLTKVLTVDGAGSGLDADLLDGVQLAALAQLSGATFTGDVRTEGTSPQFVLYQTNASADEKYWDFLVSGGNLELRALNDALASATKPMVINRTGTTIDSIALTATAVTINTSTVWHAGNDGAGSGLDADLLDGNQASAFPLLASDNNFAGRANFTSSTTTSSVTGQGRVHWNSLTGLTITGDGSTNDISFRNKNNATVMAVLTGTTTVNFPGTLQMNGSTVWTAANDGAGSGLDADTLDGAQGALYLKGARTSQLVTDGTAAPSGGSDGDIYFQYV